MKQNHQVSLMIPYTPHSQSSKTKYPDVAERNPENNESIYNNYSSLNQGIVKHNNLLPPYLQKGFFESDNFLGLKAQNLKLHPVERYSASGM